MKYYSLCHEVVKGGYTDGDVTFTPKLSGYYRVGEKIPLLDKAVMVVLDKKIRRLATDFFFTTSGAFFVSEKMRKVLEECSVDLIFVFAKITYFNGRDVGKRFFLVHVDRPTPCFDYHRSEYSGKMMILRRIDSNELDPRYKARGIKLLCIDESKTNSLDFFFVDGVTWINPVVSEAFVEKAKKEKLLVRVCDLEDFSDSGAYC